MTNSEAYLNVRNRLKDEVGNIIDNLVILYPGAGGGYWALARLLFPVIESIGSLKYGNRSTSKNLTDIFENELACVNPKYASYSQVIAQMYRNSLIHQDELRSISYEGKIIHWSVKLNIPSENLVITHREDVGQYWVSLDLTSLYKDLLTVCNALVDSPNNEAAERYEKWKLQKVTSQDSNTSMVNQLDQIIRPFTGTV
ncbi:MAG: hypothetical protein Q7K33_02850 [Candidatus Berkelbacteria bacterium]|nr:hypothetical protein [Candidatus Berkelbacteria bacterium]